MRVVDAHPRAGRSPVTDMTGRTSPAPTRVGALDAAMTCPLSDMARPGGRLTAGGGGVATHCPMPGGTPLSRARRLTTTAPLFLSATSHYVRYSSYVRLQRIIVRPAQRKPPSLPRADGGLRRTPRPDPRHHPDPAPPTGTPRSPPLSAPRCPQAAVPRHGHRGADNGGPHRNPTVAGPARPRNRTPAAPAGATPQGDYPPRAARQEPIPRNVPDCPATDRGSGSPRGRRRRIRR